MLSSSRTWTSRKELKFMNSKDIKDFNSDIGDPGIKQVEMAKEVRSAFLDYAMSVIVSRALPDVRDGLKPVHRRIIYAMQQLNNVPTQPHKKSARIVGEVIGKYHPHGDSAVYEAMVRLAQEFSMRYPLVDGHGNFGSIDGDGAAAMRYTEARMAKICGEMIRDMESNTVDMVPNYDGTETEPSVLPSRIPNLLINGSTGIAVGMATNIPPHNLTEVINGLLALMDNPNITTLELMEYIKGPDFPTAALILGKTGVKNAYETGNGSIVIRSKCDIEDNESNGKKRIIVTEIPYAVNKATMIEKIADLVKTKTIEGIVDLRDESNREGIRVVIDLKKEVIPEVILNQLYKYSQLQVSYSINMLALDNGQPRVMPLKEILRLYIEHQKVVVTRKTQFDLDKANEKLHLLEGLAIAEENVDEIVEIIKTSASTEAARIVLMSRFQLDEVQAQAILDMQLKRLTGLERDKIEAQVVELKALVLEYHKILENYEELMGVIRADFIRIRDKYGDVRKTQFSNDSSLIEDEALIPQENIVITLTTNGYIKRTAVNTYRAQGRGGVGVKGITTHSDDVVEKMIVTNTHTDLLFFTNFGKVYRLRGHQIPEYSRQGKGLPAVNLLHMEADEKVKDIIDVEIYDDEHSLVFVTEQGITKRVALSQFENIRQNGKIAVSLKEGDSLFEVKKTQGGEEIYIASSSGKVVRFIEDDVRQMGRNAAGVKGIELDGEQVVGVATSNEGKYILAITSKGYGKMSLGEDYRLTKRGSKGVKTVNVTDKNGNLVAMRAVEPNDDLLVITSKGTIIRTFLGLVKIAGRNTQGVRIIRLDEDATIASVAVTLHEDEVEVNPVEDAAIINTPIAVDDIDEVTPVLNKETDNTEEDI